MPQQTIGGLQPKNTPANAGPNANTNANADAGRAEHVRDAWSQGLNAAVGLGDYVRTEHGREGVKRFVYAIMPLVPYSMIESLARALDVPAPAPGQSAERSVRIEEDKPPSKPPMSPDQMLALVQAMGGGGQKSGGLDPKLLLQLLGS